MTGCFHEWGSGGRWFKSSRPDQYIRDSEYFKGARNPFLFVLKKATNTQSPEPNTASLVSTLGVIEFLVIRDSQKPDINAILFDLINGNLWRFCKHEKAQRTFRDSMSFSQA
jgi:hypothetical protein